MIVYISGPYRNGTINGIHDNIEKARQVAVKYWKKGYAVICPHTNTAFMDFGDDTAFLEGDLEILRKCDIIVMLKGWKKSAGARKEYEEAQEYGIEVLYE